MTRLLPKVIDNNYQGPKIALYFFIIFMIVNTWRSFVHFLAEDAGINSIANIITFEGNPDPDNLIYLFGSLWGEMQVLLCLISWIVIFRYKAFMPFFLSNMAFGMDTQSRSGRKNTSTRTDLSKWNYSRSRICMDSISFIIFIFYDFSF